MQVTARNIVAACFASIFAMVFLSACSANSDSEISMATLTAQGAVESPSATNIEVLGKVTGSFIPTNLMNIGLDPTSPDGDGEAREEHTWYVTIENLGEVYGNARRSASKFLRGQSGPTVFTVFAHTTPDHSGHDPNRALMISAYMKPDMTLYNVYITLGMGPGSKGLYKTKENNKDAQLQILHLTVENGFTHITGLFTAKLSFHAYAQPDKHLESALGDILITDGRFNVRLPTTVY